MSVNTLESKYEGDYLEALDLERPFELVIAGYTAERTQKDASGKLIKEAILSFEKAKKRLILNKTNYRILQALFGKDRNQWVGKKVTVSRRYLREAFKHPNVLCIRIVPPRGTPLPMSVHKWMGSEKPYEV